MFTGLPIVEIEDKLDKTMRVLGGLNNVVSGAIYWDGYRADFMPNVPVQQFSGGRYFGNPISEESSMSPAEAALLSIQDELAATLKAMKG
jgi:hypothetical protein